MNNIVPTSVFIDILIIKVMKKFLIIFGFLGVFTISLYSQEQIPPFILDSLDSYIKRSLHDWNIPGVAVAIVKDNKVVLSKGYGKESILRDDKVDGNTLFMIGSNTKAFTGTLMAWLQFDGKCSLNDKVQKWLPGFSMRDKWVAGELNLTDILCHRIGMETFQGDFIYWTSNLTRQEVIGKFGQLTPLYGFRTKWGYTNAGFAIAGECMRSITGESWESLLKKRILDPLEMKGSYALSEELKTRPGVAEPHTLVFDTLKLIPYPLIDNIAPAASISSSANDMSHWVLCLLSNGKYNGNQVIPARVIEDTRKPQSIIGNANQIFNRTHFSLYGLGWELADYDGRKVVSHTGGVNGFVTSVTLLPEEKLGVVVLTNTDQNYLYEALKWEIVDAYLKLPYRNYSRFYLGFFRQSAQKDLKEWRAQRDTIAMKIAPSTNLKNFTGRYVNNVYGFLDIKMSGSRLEMTFEHHPGLTGTLECLGGKRFLCTYNDPGFGIKTLSFVVEKNNVRSMVLEVADFVEKTDYLFVKQ